MSDSSRTQLLIHPETAFAEAIVSPMPTTKLRYTKSSLAHKNITVISEEIRSDRQRSDLALVGFDTSGDITHEVSFGSYFETFLQAALCGTWTANVLTNGVVNRSMLIEAGFLDIGKYIRYQGMTVDKLSLDVASQKIVLSTTTFMGSKGSAASTSMAGATTPTADGANTVMRAGDLIHILSSGGSNLEIAGVSCKQIKLDIANNLRRRDLVTQYATDDFGRGVMDITGTIDTYFKDVVIFNQFVANGLFAVRFQLTDPLLTAVANTYQFTLPRLKLTDAPVPVPGVDQDIMQTLSFRALLDTGVGYTVSVDKSIIV
jgi:tail tube protein